MNYGHQYSLKPPYRSGSKEYPQSLFWVKKNKENITNYQPKNDITKAVKASSILHRYVNLMYVQMVENFASVSASLKCLP